MPDTLEKDGPRRAGRHSECFKASHELDAGTAIKSTAQDLFVAIRVLCCKQRTVIRRTQRAQGALHAQAVTMQS
jgi:hypothetical protein